MPWHHVQLSHSFLSAIARPTELATEQRCNRPTGTEGTGPPRVWPAQLPRVRHRSADCRAARPECGSGGWAPLLPISPDFVGIFITCFLSSPKTPRSMESQCVERKKARITSIKPVRNRRCPIFSNYEPVRLKGPVSHMATDIRVITWYIQAQIHTQPVLQGLHGVYIQKQCLYRVSMLRFLRSAVSYAVRFPTASVLCTCIQRARGQ